MRRAPLTLVFVAACVGGPKEAADPREILAADLESPRERAASGTARPDPAAGALATLEECRSAARRIEELGVELAAREAEDDARRAELLDRKAELVGSVEARRRIDESARECVERGTSRREALCVGRAVDDAALDRCAEAG